MSRPGSAPHSETLGLRAFIVWLWGIAPIPKYLRGYILGWGNAWFLVGSNAVVLDRGRVLIARHTYRRRAPWGLPAGWVQHGEHPAAAVAREVAEETGYSVRVGPLIQLIHHHWPPVIDVAYLCSLTGGEFRPCAEISAARFVSPAEAEQLLTPADVSRLRVALAYADNASPVDAAS